MKKLQKFLLLALVAMLVVSATTLLVPYLLKITIDTYISQGDQAGLIRISLWTTAAYIAMYIATRTEQYLLSLVGQRMLANIRNDLFRHLQKLSLSYHDTHIVGVTVSRVMNDVATINDLLSQGIVTLLGDFLIIIGIIGLVIGFVLIFIGTKLSPPVKAGDQVVNLNVDLPGQVGMDTIKCKSCGSPLSSEDVKMVAGAPVVECPHCGTTYQLTEEPKW